MQILFTTDNGGETTWINDGFCDDLNNIAECDYDGGDCCGLSKNKNFCVDCRCKCNQITKNKQCYDHIVYVFLFILAFTCKNDEDCHGNGYCKLGECKCLPDYMYALDCSIFSCKQIY